MKNIAPEMTNPPEIVERCRKFGEYVVNVGYAHKFSTSLSSHGAERNVKLQAMAREAECAACNLIGIGYDVLNWTHPDAGFDIDQGEKIDVKATEWDNHLLIWPHKKNDHFEGKPFTILLLAKVRSPKVCFPGWLWKHEFRDLRQTSDGSNGLTPGTWFVPEDLLRPWVEIHGLLVPKRPRLIIPANTIIPYEDPAYAAFDQQRN